uniref:Polo kinase n=1 Tax=Strongyloides stercoralis TaxID=6248 RepID=A0AAF5HY29_STRER
MVKEVKCERHLPLNITCKENGATFTRGVYLGSGRFSTWYEFANLAEKEIYAGKVISKSRYNSSKFCKKIEKEIKILTSVNHKQIISLVTNFEDYENYYMVFQYCSNGTLHKLLKIKETVTEEEARHFTEQLCYGCSYLHENNIVHRNIWLDTLFLDDNMVLKIGNFGFSKKFEICDGEELYSCTSTTMYTSKEIVNRDNSFKKDIWLIGCVLYALVYGYAPFGIKRRRNIILEMSTYELTLPSFGSEDLKELLNCLLHPSPSKRPKSNEILSFNFLKNDSTPQFQGLLDLQDDILNDGMLEQTLNNVEYLKLFGMVHKLNAIIKEGKLIESQRLEIESNPSSKLPHFVATWIDNSERHDLMYQLSDGTSGIFFNDRTSVTLDASRSNVYYYNFFGLEEICPKTGNPPKFQKRVDLLMHGLEYMHGKLNKMDFITVDKCSNLNKSPVLKEWFRTSRIIVFYLSNEVLQINFFKCHTKVILSIMEGLLSTIDCKNKVEVYSLKKLEEIGYDNKIFSITKILLKVIDIIGTIKTDSSNLDCFNILSGSLNRKSVDNKDRIP